MSVPKQTRIGWIVPSINVVAEDEAIRMVPESVGIHFTRAVVDNSLPLEGQFAGMIDQLPQLAHGLSHAKVSVVAFACTSAGFFRGSGGDQDIITVLGESAGVPAVTTARAVVDALTQLGARRVAIATPYVEWVCDAERRFVEAEGFSVTHIVGMGRSGGSDISGIDAEEVRDLVAAVDSPDADTILISCTDLPTVDLIDELEDRHGKPVVTSNQATMWACRQLADIGPTDGYGALLRSTG